MDPFSILANILRKYRVSLPSDNPHGKAVPVLLLTYRKPETEILNYLKSLLNRKIICVRSLTEGVHGWIAFRWLLQAVILRRSFIIISILNEPVKELFFRKDLWGQSVYQWVSQTAFDEFDRLTEQCIQSVQWDEYTLWIQREFRQLLKVNPESMNLRFNSSCDCKSDIFKVYLITAPQTLQDIGRHLANFIDFNSLSAPDSITPQDGAGNPSADPFNFLILSFSILDRIIHTHSFKKPDSDERERLILKFGDFNEAETRNAIRNTSISFRSPFPNFIRREILKNKFWYVDIPRTSSSSLKSELGRKFGPAFGKLRIIDSEPTGIHIFPNHVPASTMKSILGESTWRQLFTFSLTRNPWDRILSLYHYRRRIGNIPEEMTFREYILALERSPGRGLFHYHGFYYSNADYICDDRNNVLVSFYGKFEERRSVLDEIGKRLGCFELGNLHLQIGKGESIHYSAFYDKETRDIVRSIYQRDIEIFGYEFEGTC